MLIYQKRKGPIMQFIKDRLKEKSTMAGITFILGLIGIHFSPDQYEAILAISISAIGLFEVFRKEK